MKKITIILVEILFVFVAAKAQHIDVAPVIEKTVAGNQYGSQLVWQTKTQWSFGGFYQASMIRGTERVQTSNPFFGITINAPISKSDKLNFYFNVRAGVVNQNFLVVAPGLETKLKFSRAISISTLMSVRMSYPSAALKIYITFN